MGAVKREVYNSTLMRSADYSDISAIRRMLCSLDYLIDLAESGDQVAMAIYVDLKTVLGFYKREQSNLTDRQIKVLRDYFINGFTQQEIGLELDLTQRCIGYIIENGVEEIRKQLMGEELNE